MENRCQPKVDWKIELACPPHREIQCSPVTKNSCIDLAFPLLPRNGYQGQADEGGQCTNLGQPGKGTSVGASSSNRNHIEVTIYSYCEPDPNPWSRSGACTPPSGITLLPGNVCKPCLVFALLPTQLWNPQLACQDSTRLEEIAITEILAIAAFIMWSPV